jgi:hypothetical protein
LTGHIDSAKLVLYVHSPGDLKENERSIIQGHLKDCTECAEELKLLQESLKEFNQRIVPVKREVSFGVQIRDWFKSILYGISWLARHPAYAYLVIILLLVYPAYLGLFKAGFKAPGVGKPSLTQRVMLVGKELVLQEQIRGEEYQIPEIILDTATDVLRLRIPYPIDTSFATRYEAVIKDSVGSIIWAEKNWREYDIRGGTRFWIFDLNPAVLSSGLIQVQIREYEPGQISQMPASIYQFRIRKSQ